MTIRCSEEHQSHRECIEYRFIYMEVDKICDGCKIYARKKNFGPHRSTKERAFNDKKRCEISSESEAAVYLK